jgi:hypothetical protein
VEPRPETVVAAHLRCGRRVRGGRERDIKLTGDHYLARVYRLALDRFDLTPFREGISRKLATLWSSQQVVLDLSSSRRNEVLELIIILLIAVEILHALD